MTASESTPAEGESATGRLSEEELRAFMRCVGANSNVLRDLANFDRDDDPELVARELRQLSAMSGALAHALEEGFKVGADDGGATTE